MNLIQFCWMLFVFFTLYFFFFTNWSIEGFWKMKFVASAFVAACVSGFIYLVFEIFIWLGEGK